VEYRSTGDEIGILLNASDEECNSDKLMCSVLYFFRC